MSGLGRESVSVLPNSSGITATQTVMAGEEGETLAGPSSGQTWKVLGITITGEEAGGEVMTYTLNLLQIGVAPAADATIQLGFGLVAPDTRSPVPFTGNSAGFIGDLLFDYNTKLQLVVSGDGGEGLGVNIGYIQVN